jgi:hypothetical protein
VAARLGRPLAEGVAARPCPLGWLPLSGTGRCNWVHPRYKFTQVSDDIRRIFCDTCDLVGVRWTASGNHTIYISRKADVAILDEFIGPKR